MEKEPHQANRRMDDLLKAYAKKRREQGGKPVELHPATRTMLQGEVARTFASQTAVARSRPKLFEKWWLWARPPSSGPSHLGKGGGRWPRLAMAGTVFALLTVAALMVLHIQTKPPEQFALTKNEAQTSQSKAGRMVAANNHAIRELPPGGRGSVRATTPHGDDRASPSKKSEIMLEFPNSIAADKAAPMEKANKVALGDTDKESAAPAPSEPMSKDVVLDRTRDESNKQLLSEHAQSISRRMQFAQTTQSLPATPAAKVEAKTGQNEKSLAEKVLASFQMEQNGDEIQITDADGSVYTGKIEMTDLKAPSAPIHSENLAEKLESPLLAPRLRSGQAPSLPKRLAKEGQGEVRSAEKPPEVPLDKGDSSRKRSDFQTGSRQALSQTQTAEKVRPEDQKTEIQQQIELGTGDAYSFRVRGMNQTLKRMVELQGHFMTESPVRSKAASSTGRANSPARGDQKSRARVQGRAQITGANEIEIDAILIEP